MDIADLNLFAAVARYGSITKAAAFLNTVQSNVTTKLRSLEDELGVPLFHRHYQGVSLTRSGQDLLPYAHQLRALVQEAKSMVSPQKEPHGVLRIGSLETTASVRLPKLLKAYTDRYSKVDLAIETGPTRSLVEAVLEYRLDGAFVTGPIDHEELTQTPAFVEEVVVVTAPRYRSFKTALETGRFPKMLVFRVGCSYRQKLERFLAEQNVGPINQMEFGTLDGIIGCVSAGLGITMLPLSVVEERLRRKELAVHRLPADHAILETQFITRRNNIFSVALKEFIATIECTRESEVSKPRTKKHYAKAA